MRTILGACCALAWSSATAQALVTIDFVEKSTEMTLVAVPLTGGTYDIAVVLTSDEQVRGVRSASISISASQAGLITVLGNVGGAGSAGSGSRYNSPSWDSNLHDAAWNPDNIAGPLSTAPKGLFGTDVRDESLFFQRSVMGWIRVVLSPAPIHTSVLIAPAESIFIEDAVRDYLPFALGRNVVFHYVPEPTAAMCLLALAVGFLGKKRGKKRGKEKGTFCFISSLSARFGCFLRRPRGIERG